MKCYPSLLPGTGGIEKTQLFGLSFRICVYGKIGQVNDMILGATVLIYFEKLRFSDGLP